MINKVLFFIITFLFPTSLLFGQSFVYQKKFKTGGLNHAYSIVECSDTGNIFFSMVKPSLFSNHQEINLTKFDKFGNISWSKVYGDGFKTDWLLYPIRTMDNGFFGTGQNFGADSSSGSGEMLAFKVDSAGNIQWVKLIGTSRNEFGLHAIELPDSSFALMGGSVGGGNNDRDFLFVRLDYFGNLISSKFYGDTLYDQGETVTLINDGGFMIGGWKRNNGVTPPDIYIIRLDSSGNVLWSKTYGTSGLEEVRNIVQTSDNGYLLTGFTASGSAWRGLAFKIDSIGNLIWSKTYDQSGAYLDFYACIPQNDSTFLVSGHGGGAFIAKMDSIGDIIWFNTYNNAIGSNFCINKNGDFSFATAKSGFDTLLIVRTDPSGNSCNQNTAPINVVNISLTTNNVITYSGDTGVIKNYSIPVAIYSPFNQFDCITTSIEIPEIEHNEFNVFPNPTKGSFIISLDGMLEGGKVEIKNLFGENVFIENILNESRKEINLKNIAQGIYFVKVFDREKYYCKKLIVE